MTTEWEKMLEKHAAYEVAQVEFREALHDLAQGLVSRSEVEHLIEQTRRAWDEFEQAFNRTQSGANRS